MQTSRVLGRDSLDTYMGQHLTEMEIVNIHAQNKQQAMMRGEWKYGVWMEMAKMEQERGMASTNDEADGLPALERG